MRNNILTLLAGFLLLTGTGHASLIGLWEFNNDLSNSVAGGSAMTTRSDSGKLIVEGYGSATINGGPTDTYANLSRLGFDLPGANGEHWLEMPNDTGGTLSTWTMIMDINFDQGFQDTFSALFQTDTGNSGDGDSFVQSSGIGISGDYVGTINSATWYRITMQYTGGSMNYFIDGAFANTVTTTDSRFELGDPVLLFVDNQQETSEVLVSTVALYDEVLSSGDIAGFGGANTAPIPEPSAALLSGIALLATFVARRRHRLG